MALKKVDFKQILLAKGERIGLYVGLGVMGLLVVGFGLGSLLGEGPQKKVSNLEGLRKQAQAAYDSSTPDDSVDKLPPELNVVALQPVSAALYPAKRAFFQPLSSEDRKWRQPAVLGPDEFQVALVRGEVQIYVLGEDPKKNRTIGVLKTKTVSELTAEQRKERDKFNKNFPGMVQKATKKRPRQTFNLTNIPNVPGVPGVQGLPGRPGSVPTPGIGQPRGEGGAPFPGVPGLQGLNRAAGQEHELKMVLLDKMSEENGILAQTSLPVRVLQISAAFPYRLQLEEFRKALRLNSVDELFYEPASTPEFTGYSIQRQVYGPNGKIVKEWTDFDYETPMRQLRIRTKEVEPEDPVLVGDGLIVRPNRLVMPHPKLFGPPRDFKWPEPRLEGIERTKDEMEKVRKDDTVTLPELKTKKSRFEEIDPFDDGQTSANTPGGEAMVPETRQGGFPNPRPGVGRAPAPGARGVPNEGPGSVQRPTVFPQEILVRFLDVTVQPGYSYEYRIKIRMANPNYEQPERAVSKRLIKDKEIEGNWIPVKWKKDGQEMTRFHVSDELLYYAMQDEGQGGGEGSSKKVTTNKDQAVMQVQRWLENVRTKPEQQSNELPVGDWSVLKERVVHRGEYVGQWAEVEVPAWLISEDHYGLAIHPDEQKTVRRGNRKGIRFTKHKGIPVDFATDPVSGGKALVVDFEGGERTISVDGKPKKITGPVEMLIYTADGKLVVHNSQRDTADPQRQKRFQEWEQWLTQVKNQADNPKVDGPGNIFRPKNRAPGGG